MLNYKNPNDRIKMMDYYRTSDMINLLNYFPNLSPITDIVLVDTLEEYIENKPYLETFSSNRVDTLKGRKPITGIENAGHKDVYYKTLQEIKDKDKYGVLVLFNLSCIPSERYERYAGISVRVTIGEEVIIDAVSKGFDGREVSKSICVHERYRIPWFDLRKLSIENFKNYQTYRITNDDYVKTRNERVEFLTKIGLDPNVFTDYIPNTYQEIPDFIWKSVLENLLKQLEKNEDILINDGFTTFAISGHTEEEHFAPWGMFDKSRYELSKRR